MRSRLRRRRRTARQAGRVSSAAGAVPDDRDSLTPGKRLILVVEDDVPFALILRDLAHEMDFQCVVVHAAEDALTAAAQFQPSAILLDINLPDFSGLGVLDQLKRNLAHAAHSGARGLGRDYSARRSSWAPSGYALEAREARGAGRGAEAARAEALAERAPRAHRRGRCRGSARASASSSATAMCRSPAAETASEALRAALDDDLRLHGAGFQPAGLQRAMSCSREWRSRTRCRFRRSSSTRAASLTRDEEQRLRPLLQLDHHQGCALAGAAARTRSRCSCTRSSRSCPPAQQQMLQGGARPRRLPRGPAHPGRRGRCAQHLRADQRARAERRDGRDRAQRPRGARGAGAQHAARPRAPSIWCSWTS